MEVPSDRNMLSARGFESHRRSSVSEVADVLRPDRVPRSARSPKRSPQTLNVRKLSGNAGGNRLTLGVPRSARSLSVQVSRQNNVKQIV